MTNKILVYPGAGWDTSFSTLPIRKYERYILIDALPATPHYVPDQPGWLFTSSKERFFNVLEAAYGKLRAHDEERGVLYLGNNVEYWYNVDTNALLPGEGPLPQNKEYDVYLSGFLPDWCQHHFGPKSLVYVFKMWSFRAVLERKYSSKKRHVNLTGLVSTREGVTENERILEAVFEKENAAGTESANGGDGFCEMVCR